jgi:hypothetical protein
VKALPAVAATTGLAVMYVLGVVLWLQLHPSLFGMTTGQVLIATASILSVGLALIVGRSMSSESRRYLAIAVGALVLVAAAAFVLDYVGLLGGPPLTQG